MSEQVKLENAHCALLSELKAEVQQSAQKQM